MLVSRALSEVTMDTVPRDTYEVAVMLVGLGWLFLAMCFCKWRMVADDLKVMARLLEQARESRDSALMALEKLHLMRNRYQSGTTDEWASRQTKLINENLVLERSLRHANGMITHLQHQLKAQRSETGAQFSPDEIKVLVRLCHPDRHGNSATANSMTQKLNTMKGPRQRRARS